MKVSTCDPFSQAFTHCEHQIVSLEGFLEAGSGKHISKGKN